jgi:hypothetical protein
VNFINSTAFRRIRPDVLRVVLGVFFLVGCIDASLAQSEPPLSVPAAGPLVGAADAIPLGRWLLFPSIRSYTLYSDNIFQSATAPISAFAFGTSPSLTALWSNGIHTTKLYANIDRQVYPTDNAINTFDRQANATQTYSPLPDLTFNATGDYTHKTISSGLTNSIPTPIATPAATPTVLPNGNTQLPNGTVVSPAGQIVGQANSAGVAGTSSVNPNNQFTGTLSANKIFNNGILAISSSTARTDYENPGTPGFTIKSFAENGSFGLGPLLYLYSNGSLAMTSNASPNPNSSAYRVVGGVGTRQFGLFRGSFYFGHQGSEVQDSPGNAGGEVYGGSISYYPTPVWTLTASVDETVNISTETGTSNQALTIPAQTPLQIPLSASTRITATSLQTTYAISSQWTASGSINYTRAEYIGSTRLDNSWFADATLSYDIWRNLTLAWEYQYASILSNAPFTSSKKNYVSMSAAYKF